MPSARMAFDDSDQDTRVAVDNTAKIKRGASKVRQGTARQATMNAGKQKKAPNTEEATGKGGPSTATDGSTVVGRKGVPQKTRAATARPPPSPSPEPPFRLPDVGQKRGRQPRPSSNRLKRGQSSSSNSDAEAVIKGGASVTLDRDEEEDENDNAVYGSTASRNGSPLLNRKLELQSQSEADEEESERSDGTQNDDEEDRGDKSLEDQNVEETTVPTSEEPTPIRPVGPTAKVAAVRMTGILDVIKTMSVPNENEKKAVASTSSLPAQKIQPKVSSYPPSAASVPASDIDRGSREAAKPRGRPRKVPPLKVTTTADEQGVDVADDSNSNQVQLSSRSMRPRANPKKQLLAAATDSQQGEENDKDGSTKVPKPVDVQKTSSLDAAEPQTAAANLLEDNNDSLFGESVVIPSVFSSDESEINYPKLNVSARTSTSQENSEVDEESEIRPAKFAVKEPGKRLGGPTNLQTSIGTTTSEEEEEEDDEKSDDDIEVEDGDVNAAPKEKASESAKESTKRPRREWKKPQKATFITTDDEETAKVPEKKAAYEKETPKKDAKHPGVRPKKLISVNDEDAEKQDDAHKDATARKVTRKPVVGKSRRIPAARGKDLKEDGANIASKKAQSRKVTERATEKTREKPQADAPTKATSSEEKPVPTRQTRKQKVIPANKEEKQQDEPPPKVPHKKQSTRESKLATKGRQKKESPSKAPSSKQPRAGEEKVTRKPVPSSKNSSKLDQRGTEQAKNLKKAIEEDSDDDDKIRNLQPSDKLESSESESESSSSEEDVPAPKQQTKPKAKESAKRVEAVQRTTRATKVTKAANRESSTPINHQKAAIFKTTSVKPNTSPTLTFKRMTLIERICEAIDHTDNIKGATVKAIKKYIEANDPGKNFNGGLHFKRAIMYGMNSGKLTRPKKDIDFGITLRGRFLIGISEETNKKSKADARAKEVTARIFPKARDKENKVSPKQAGSKKGNSKTNLVTLAVKPLVRINGKNADKMKRSSLGKD